MREFTNCSSACSVMELVQGDCSGGKSEATAEYLPFHIVSLLSAPQSRPPPAKNASGDPTTTADDFPPSLSASSAPSLPSCRDTGSQSDDWTMNCRHSSNSEKALFSE